MSLLYLLSRMDPPQEGIDETAESLNPLDPSASGPSESTMNENASTEALEKVSQDMARVTWDYFVIEFNTKYVTDDYTESKWKKFLTLRQGKMTVAEYEKEFSRLSKYVKP